MTELMRDVERRLRPIGPIAWGGNAPRPMPVPTETGAVRMEHVIHYPTGWRAYWGARDGHVVYLLVPPEVQ
ncbi:hypothetical protein [Thermus albus]|uniref:hypothetical protein n=1 Tax=Thermus albus TaxID=2908146 RepID=UPI001FAB34BC|nr:hypothetical protein [Thermus albus]